jgi:hypothetical protein
MIMDGMDKNKPGAEDIVDTMLAPEGQKKLAPIKMVADEMGFSMSPEEILIAAQKDDRTQGKSPQEVADMLSSDETLYDDLEAMASGKMDKMKADMGIKPAKAESPMPEGEMPAARPPAVPGAM